MKRAKSGWHKVADQTRCVHGPKHRRPCPTCVERTQARVQFVKDQQRAVDNQLGSRSRYA